MRPLTEEEKRLTENNLKRLKSELEGDEIFKEHLVFNVEKFIDYTADLNKKRANAELKAAKLRILQTEEAVRLTEETLKNGVEVKEESEATEGAEE